MADHYLAEMYLALGQPDSAAIYAQKVINSGDYRLVTARYGVNANKPTTSRLAVQLQ